MIKFSSENDFEMFLYNHFLETSESLVDEKKFQHCIRQFNAGAYGKPDLVYFTKLDDDIAKAIGHEYEISVIEIKNEPIKNSDVSQICRYKTGFERSFDCSDVEISFSLVVPKGSIKNHSDICWTIENLSDVHVYEFDLDPREGIKFDLSYGWMKTDEDIDLIKSVIEGEFNER